MYKVYDNYYNTNVKTYKLQSFQIQKCSMLWGEAMQTW